MKVILLLYNLFVFISCSNKYNNYEGYIYGEKSKMPLRDINICGRSNLKNCIQTDEKGFFKLKQQKNRISKFLIVSSASSVLDSIQVIRTSGGEKINYYFTKGRKDTLFVKNN